MVDLFGLITYHRHPSITVSRARHDESTSNLARHVRNCAPTDSAQTRALATYASGSKYTKASHRMKIALWVSNRHRPFSIIEDTELLDIFTDLNPNCESPKHHTVSRDVKEIFGLSRSEVAMMLQVGHITQVDWSTITHSYLMLACRSTPECFMLLLMDGHHPMLLHLLERLSIGSGTARSHRLSLTSSSKF